MAFRQPANDTIIRPHDTLTLEADDPVLQRYAITRPKD